MLTISMSPSNDQKKHVAQATKQGPNSATKNTYFRPCVNFTTAKKNNKKKNGYKSNINIPKIIIANLLNTQYALVSALSLYMY